MDEVGAQEVFVNMWVSFKIQVETLGLSKEISV